MSTLASLKTEVAQSACFKCLPVNYQEAIKTYLLAVRAGGSLDPKTLLAQARGFNGVQSGLLPSLQAAFANVAAGGSGDISVFVNQNKCDVTCLTVEDGLVMQIVALASNLGLAAIPKTLARLAACFICIPPGKLIMLQTYLTGVISGLISVPPTIPGTSIPIGPPPTIPTPIMRFAIKNFGYPPQFFQAFMDRAIYVWPPGPGGGGGTGVINPLTTLWLNNITINGGPPPSTTTGTAINTLFNAMDACGATSKILSFCMFVPDSFIAATTPLIAGTTNPWANTNFVGGDLTVNGLTGNGATKFLDPGLRPAFAGPQFTVANCCLFFYAHTSGGVALGTEMGCTDGANDCALVSNFNFGGLACFSDLLGAGARLSVATPGNGFYLASRIAANNNQIYFANSATPWASIGNNALGSSGLSTTGNLVFAFNNNGAAAQWSNSTLSCAGFAAGLTTAEGQCLFNAIQACRVALGGGFR